DRRVEPQPIRLVRAGEVQPRYAREQDLDEVAAVVLADGHEHASRMALRRRSVQRVLEPGHFGVEVQVLELGVVRGVGPVPEVLQPERDDNLVDQGFAETRNLDELAVAVGRPVLLEDTHLLPARTRIDPDRRLRDLY